MSKRIHKSAAIGICLGSLACAALVSGCAVDLDDFVYDDDEFEQAKAGLGGGSGDGNEPSEFCLQLCEDSAEFCPFGSNLGYDSKEDCETSCAGYDAAALECRLVELTQAEDDPVDHCPATLLDGGGICPDQTPDPCTAFCNTSAEICPFGTELGYESETDCLELCATFSSENLRCREVHLGFAAESADAPLTHCPHTLLDGGGQCEDATPDPCAIFCTDANETCGFGTDLGYADAETCLVACRGYDAAEFRCREIHLGFAAETEDSPLTHCPHTLPDGGGACADATD